MGILKAGFSVIFDRITHKFFSMAKAVLVVLFLLNAVVGAAQTLVSGIYTTIDGIDQIKVSQTDSEVIFEYITESTNVYKKGEDGLFYDVYDKENYVKVISDNEFYYGNPLGEFQFIYSNRTDFEPDPFYEDSGDEYEEETEESIDED
ncbi:hypothetical protein NU09_3334 [Flavobacterium beibuense]|uniref:Uncharacterized protein n=2 Tax=Flavobacterium beibuense TaxID=657326 RepID=A0A444W3Y6_9FLAO|nr:hypothetical protein NU09_3334 [Flavobacterium beibuense]